ncbi:MAG: hypothetical protein ABSD20_18300 [Terriglobales bacterium]|jgi:hypothetical protein
MARKKPKPFRATKAVKSLARTVIGSPPPARAIPDPKRKMLGRPKHKTTLGKLLSDNQ